VPLGLFLLLSEVQIDGTTIQDRLLLAPIRDDET
jgi:hypothetical protein